MYFPRHTRVAKFSAQHHLRHFTVFTMARTKQTGRKSTGGRVPAADIPAKPSTQHPHIANVSPTVLPPNSPGDNRPSGERFSGKFVVISFTPIYTGFYRPGATYVLMGVHSLHVANAVASYVVPTLICLRGIVLKQRCLYVHAVIWKHGARPNPPTL